jgi:glycosyltransferase involved in cell wall biosynthesis
MRGFNPHPAVCKTLSCPDPNLCRRLKRHLSPGEYRAYHEYPAYREAVQRQAGMFSITLIIPTISRPTLKRTLDSLKGQPWQRGDEVIVVGDGKQPAAKQMWRSARLKGRYLEVLGPSGDWGHTPRNVVNPSVRSGFIAALDDDDIWTPNALASIRAAITADPDRPHIFGMKCYPPMAFEGICTPMLVCPAIPGKLGKYTPRYGGDQDFAAETIAFYPGGAVRHDEAICLVRPPSDY